MTRIGLAIIWALHLLPLSLLASMGRGAGWLLYWVARERRQVALTNLKLCFPESSDTERQRMALAHFQALARSLLEHGLLWWSSKARVQKLVRVEGLEHWKAVEGKPVIWLAPHFVGLDMGGARIITEWRGVSVYSQQKNPAFDKVLLHGRTRFVTPVLFSRQDGIRPVVKAIREGLPFYYLPDMDFGERDSIFVPFFGVQAATITGLSRLAHLARAVVVPAVTRQLPGAQGYELRFYPAWENFPSNDAEADTRRMNTFIEERVREMPEQYYWVHKRFKTRPPGRRVYMNDAAVIRPLRDDDIPALVALAREIWRAHYPGIISTAQIEYMLGERYDEAVIREERARHDLWWDVLMLSNQMTGYASYFLTDTDGEMKIDKLYLHPRAHRQGYGGKLMDHVAVFAVQRGCRRLTLAVNRHNHTAIAAYQKHGFQVASTSVREIGGGFLMDDYIMTKRLNG